jgi:hypothetical protein
MIYTEEDYSNFMNKRDNLKDTEAFYFIHTIVLKQLSMNGLIKFDDNSSLDISSHKRKLKQQQKDKF